MLTDFFQEYIQSQWVLLVFMARVVHVCVHMLEILFLFTVKHSQWQKHTQGEEVTSCYSLTTGCSCAQTHVCLIIMSVHPSRHPLLMKRSDLIECKGLSLV